MWHPTHLHELGWCVSHQCSVSCIQSGEKEYCAASTIKHNVAYSDWSMTWDLKASSTLTFGSTGWLITENVHFLTDGISGSIEKGMEGRGRNGR